VSNKSSSLVFSILPPMLCSANHVNPWWHLYICNPRPLWKAEVKGIDLLG
jgi:hypothetical protein